MSRGAAGPLRAVIDIGSNSILLLIASRRVDGIPVPIVDRGCVARICEGAAASGRFSPAAIERALAVLREYADEIAAAKVESVHAVATEGVRMVANARDFLGPAAQILGVPVEILTGEQEARLSYLSVAVEEPRRGELRVLDIGGASTELVVGEGLELRSAVSHPVGSVRLHEALVDGDPPSTASLRRIEARVREAFASQPVSPLPELHGLAGTVTTAAALLLGLARYERDRVHGTRFARRDIEGLRDRLAAMTAAERLLLPCLGPGRADVIVAGVSILLVALEHCGADTLVVRDRGLRYALL